MGMGMGICQQLEELVSLLTAVEAEARNRGFNTVTLTHEEIGKLTTALTSANEEILQENTKV